MSAHQLLHQLYLDGTPHDVQDPGDAGTLYVDRQFAVIALTTGASGETRTLPDPKMAGQRLFLYMKTDGGGDCVVTASSAVDLAANTAITFGDVGDYVDLVGVEDGSSTYAWRAVDSKGVAGLYAVTADGVGAANGTGVAAVEYGEGDGIHKTVLTFTDHAIALTDEAGVVAYGGSKVYDFPAGAIYVLGAVSDVDLTKSSAGVNVDWDGDFGVGTATAGNDATLATTEQDIIPTTATPQASAGATTANGQSTATENKVHDGTTTAKDVYFNLLVDDADHDVTTTACNLILNGTLTLLWANLGDY